MENDTTATAEVELQTPIGEPQPHEVQGEAPAQETPAEKQRRIVRLMASEIELPDFDDSDVELPEETRARLRERIESVYGRFEEVAGQLNKGVDSKFKEAAQARQAIEAERAQVQQWRQMQETLLQSDREAVALWQQLEPYQQVDWYAQIQQAPDAETKQKISDLKDWYESNTRKLNEAAGRSRSIRQQELAQATVERQHLVQRGHEVLKQQIKDWGPAKQDLVTRTMAEYGIGKTHPKLDEAAILAIDSHPGLIMALHDAALYRASLKKAQTASQPEAPAPARPASKVGGNAPAARDPDKMSTDEWLKWRESQLRKK